MTLNDIVRLQNEVCRFLYNQAYITERVSNPSRLPRGISALTDAIMGTRSFNDAAVRLDQQILLSSDRKRASDWIAFWRAAAKQKALMMWLRLERSEPAMYQDWW